MAQPTLGGDELGKGAKIRQVFASLNRKFEEQETQRRAAKLSMPYFSLTGFPIDEQTLSIVPKEQAETALTIPFYKEGPLVRLGVVDAKNLELKKILEEMTHQKYQIELYLVSETSFDSALQQYKKVVHATPRRSYEVPIAAGPEVLEQFRGLSSLGEELLEMPATRLLNLILGAAVAMSSSDVHIEPEKSDIKIRFRVDGVLQNMSSLPLKLQHVLLSRIKLLSGMKLNVTTIAQDGRFSVKLADRTLDLRVSALPSAHGETIVMRLLGLQEVGLNLTNLGLRGLALTVIERELKKPNGMTLTTGPTGSGKTTTLYAFLNLLNKPGVKIITLEDPVEYQLAGVIQTPIDRSAGMDFAKGLRSILRQDPDIIMVGEIRDYETAETAAQAALTGHVVLSTMHTNDAAGAIPRLLDLGVKPVTLAPALTALIAQRLLRKICTDCKKPYRPTEPELKRVKQILGRMPSSSGLKIPEHLTFWRSLGCEKCHHLGYRGRIGVFEAFAVDDPIERLIFNQASTNDIKKAAQASGMVTMQQDGIFKALEGITDLSEVWRVTEE
ncbi:MAG: type II/IV secretion system protein [Candidatus Doudnabacteria bacterium]|nr:type II/IV secretion system protein [Candidatus Doudnabacteria bacterium]